MEFRIAKTEFLRGLRLAQGIADRKSTIPMLANVLLRTQGKNQLERFNVFAGDNGQGKTNLLEAIFVVAALRSFRTSKLSDLIAFGGERAKVGARVRKDDMVRVYEVEVEPGTRRVALDGKAVRPLARYFGGFNVV